MFKDFIISSVNSYELRVIYSSELAHTENKRGNANARTEICIAHAFHICSTPFLWHIPGQIQKERNAPSAPGSHRGRSGASRQ